MFWTFFACLACFLVGWYGHAWRVRPAHTPPPVDTDLPLRDATVRAVFAEVGLPADAYHDGFDLLPTGKLTEVLHLAARRLGRDPELNTVGDVKKWLKEEGATS